MNATRRVALTADGLRVGKEILPLYSGSFQYWRNAPAAWGPIMHGIREMGFRVIETYTPWGVHETARGSFDFGSIDPNKDLAAFFRACSDNGLYVCVRPGPNYIAELPWFGIPERIVKDERIQARTSTGAPAVLVGGFFAPFAAPSYACERFYEEAEAFFDAVCPIIRENLYPQGPIIMVQADNENSFFFRTACYDLDYHPESIALYRRFLTEKYRTTDALNRAYSSSHRSFDDIAPPRGFAAINVRDLVYYLDWAEYKEYYLRHSLLRVKGMLESRGVRDVPFYHNYPVIGPATPFNVVSLESELDIAGVDCYPRPQQYREIKTGAAYTSTVSRLPFLAEFLCGVWTFNKPLSPMEERFITQAVFMHGIRGANFYMLAEREHWTGCPLTGSGERRSEYFELYKRWIDCASALKLHTLRPERTALLIMPRMYGLLESAAVRGDFPYDFLLSFYFKIPRELFRVDDTFGLRDAPQRSARPWLDAARVALESLGVPYALADDTLPTARLCDYPVVFMPTFELCDPGAWKTVCEYARTGGTAVVGPRLPRLSRDGGAIPLGFEGVGNPGHSSGRVTLEGVSEDILWVENADRWDQSSEGSGKGQSLELRLGEQPPFLKVLEVGKGRVILIGCVFPEPHETKAGESAYAAWSPWLSDVLKGAGIAPSWHCSDPAVDIAILSSADRRVVCVANPTAESRTCEIVVAGASTWRRIEIWGDEPSSAGRLSNGCLALASDAYSISFWEVS